MPVEKAQKIVDLGMAVKLIDSNFPGFEELYDSGQLPKAIARSARIMRAKKKQKQLLATSN